MRDSGAGGLVGAGTGQLLAGERDLAALPHSAGDGPQRGCLAGAVRAEQSDDLTLLDVQGDAVQRLDRPVTRLDATQLKQRRNRSLPSTPR